MLKNSDLKQIELPDVTSPKPVFKWFTSDDLLTSFRVTLDYDSISGKYSESTDSKKLCLEFRKDEVILFKYINLRVNYGQWYH